MHSYQFSDGTFVFTQHIAIDLCRQPIFICYLKGNITDIAVNQVAAFGIKIDMISFSLTYI